MSVVTYRHHINFGEGVRWTPPAGTGAFFAWGKHAGADMAMRWRRLAGWDVANNRSVDIPDAPSGRGIQLSSAEVGMNWTDLLVMYDGFDNEIMQITTHADHDAMALVTRDVYMLPPPTSTNASTIAAQERRVLKDLLEMRLGLAGMHAGHVKVSTPDGTQVERMPIAVIDRRISEIRARIAWFEAASEGDTMPGASWAGLGSGTDRTTTVAATPSPPRDVGTTIMRAGFSSVIPHGQSTWRWAGTVNGVALDSSWTQPASFALWAPGDLLSRVVAVVLLRTVFPGTPGDPVDLAAFGPPEEYMFGNTVGLAISTPVSFTGQFSWPNDIRAILAEPR